MDLKAAVEFVLQAAKTRGAHCADVSGSVSDGLSVTVRLGEVDIVEFNRDKGISITAYHGKARGHASSSDTTESALLATVDAAISIAKVTGEDPCHGLPDKETLAFNYPELDLHHPWDLLPEDAITIARNMEAAGFDIDERIDNSEGATVNTHNAHIVHANSLGFFGEYRTSSADLSCVYVARDKSGMQRDYDYDYKRDYKNLSAPQDIATMAANKTIARLNPQPLKTQQAPVLFAPNVARRLIGECLRALNGANQYRKNSFLADAIGQQIFPEFIHIHESPHTPKGLGSAPFDSEGVITRENNFIKNGIIENYILSTYSARRLNRQTTGNAGGTHNCQVAPSHTLAELMTQCQQGFLVTDLMGHGGNVTNGDYSQGASGFWLEDGKPVFAVENLTIAGNLKDMFANIVGVADDIDHRGNIQTGSILIRQMMIAGQ